MGNINVNINGYELTAYQGETVLDVAKRNKIDIPTLCNDKRVLPYGSCGLCIVEIEGNPKLARACATEIANGMIIKTNTEKVKASRRLALELLLSDHKGDCRPPCTLACPGQTDCQEYVGLIANKEYIEATKVIKSKLPLPSSIGRVCPHPCETSCRRKNVEEAISICRLKAFAADHDLFSENPYIPEFKDRIKKQVAIIGGGPGGLSAAYYLIQNVENVTIYDAMPKMGGMLRYGIPEYRLPKEIVDREASIIEKMGVKFINNIKVGEDVTFSHIKDSYDAVIICIGAWESVPLGCKGEDIKGVIGGIDFLRHVALNEELETDIRNKKVAVVGGGNTAMDACRTAVRIGASEVYNIYRRTREEMPAEEIEKVEAEEEGVIFKFLTNPIEVIEEDGKVAKVRLQKMELGEPDESGRRRPVEIKGAEEILDVDCVVMAIGQRVNPKGFEGVTLTRRNTILADEGTFKTNFENVFAVGDATNKGADIAIAAIGEGKRAYEVILGYLKGEEVPYKKPYVVERKNMTAADFEEYEKSSRKKLSHLLPKERKTNFKEVTFNYNEQYAIEESLRCLECGCADYYECKLIKYANEYDVKPEKLEGEILSEKEDKASHPFITVNPEKCILCGLCVRVCDEVMGVTALGLYDRGFEASVKPELKKKLKDTDCVSCGQCVNLCPTGALTEKLFINKSVPVKETFVDDVCGFCSVGCENKYALRGDHIFRSIPKGEEGLLCVKGRFGFKDIYENRIVSPYINKEGKLLETNFKDAYTLIAKKIQEVYTNYGKDSLAVSISDKYTNEEIYLIKKYAEDVIKTKNIYSFNLRKSGMKEVLGFSDSPNTFDELNGANLIVLFGSNIMKDHTVAAIKVRDAVKNGAKLVTVNPFESKLDEIAEAAIRVENDLSFLKQLAKALIDLGAEPKNSKGFEEFKEGLKDVAKGEDAVKLADMYLKAKKAIIIFDEKYVSFEASKLLAEIALISGHIGKPREGIVSLKQNNNTQGLIHMGVNEDGEELIKKIENGDIKGLLIFGEDVLDVDLSKVKSVIVFDGHMTDTCKKAEIVMPFNLNFEGEGTYTNTDRKVRKVNRILPSRVGISNYDIINNLALASQVKLQNATFESLLSEISLKVDGYKNVKAFLGEFDIARIPVGESPVLQNKKAEFFKAEDGSAFCETQNTNYIYRRFMEYLKKEGLLREK